MPVFDADKDLPEDWRKGLFAGRIDRGAGPTPILVRDGHVFDVSSRAATSADLLEMQPLPKAGEDLGPLDEVALAVAPDAGFRLLSPIDLQCVKAAGVTFAVSALERVIEERARGDSGAAADIRSGLEAAIGTNMRSVIPGSPEAAVLKSTLIKDGMWSQYLEVAIGPDAEIFTKAPVLSTVGWGSEIGVRSDSDWNNPEPEIVLVVNSAGTPVGATLGNDVNLRDFEGRSALLLGKAKDNNASCALGPFIRLFDDSFTLDDVRRAEVHLEIEGADKFTLSAVSSMSLISRDPVTLIDQALSEHQYPDGFVLFLGTMFAPTEDRDGEGRGFTHKLGDRVTVSSSKLGALINDVTTSKAAAPWEFGVRALMTNLADRGLLTR
jgi:fumarylacetoacetate (FAA) hydrolase family protein